MSVTTSIHTKEFERVTVNVIAGINVGDCNTNYVTIEFNENDVTLFVSSPKILAGVLSSISSGCHEALEQLNDWEDNDD